MAIPRGVDVVPLLSKLSRGTTLFNSMGAIGANGGGANFGASYLNFLHTLRNTKVTLKNGILLYNGNNITEAVTFRTTLTGYRLAVTYHRDNVRETGTLRRRVGRGTKGSIYIYRCSKLRGN